MQPRRIGLQRIAQGLLTEEEETPAADNYKAAHRSMQHQLQAERRKAAAIHRQLTMGDISRAAQRLDSTGFAHPTEDVIAVLRALHQQMISQHHRKRSASQRK